MIISLVEEYVQVDEGLDRYTKTSTKLMVGELLGS